LQPRVPLDDNYYNLLDASTQEWQAKLAREHGIDGFCYYHYWFEGEQLLEKPAENMLKNPKVDIPFCFSWANHDWTRTWGGPGKNQLLKKQTY
jgi:lipopolysaccharide biosynthesis protein